MAFTTTAADGTVLNIALGDKIPLDGQDLIVTGIGSYANGMRRRQPLISPRALELYRFDQLDPTTGAPTYLDPVTVPVQVKEAKDQRSQLITAKDGPDSPDTFRQAYLAEANWPAAGYPLIQIVLQDEAHGLMFPGLWTFQLILTSVTGADADAGDPGRPDDDPTTLTTIRVDARDQYENTPEGLQKCGDSRVVIRNGQVSVEQLQQVTAVMLWCQCKQVLGVQRGGQQVD